MKVPTCAWRLRLTGLMIPILAASCGGPAPTTEPVRPPEAAPQTQYRVEREVTLAIDPQAGTINGRAPLHVLAELEAALHLDVDVANLEQVDGRTRFLVVMRNTGGQVDDLHVVVTGDRPLYELASPLKLGTIPDGAEGQQVLTFDNPEGQPFAVTLRFAAAVSGTEPPRQAPPVSTPEPEPSAATPAPTAVPTATPTPRRSGGGGGGGGGAKATPAPTPTPTPDASATATPTPGPTATAEPTPSPTPTATPTPEATATPTPAPTATPTPTPGTTALPTANPTTPPGPVANPGPNAARGRVLVNGQPVANIRLSLLGNAGFSSDSVYTDAQGYFLVQNLPAGNYYAYYYNEKDRDKIGYWRSREQRVDATTGAAFPTVDFYGKGMTNVPKMDARVSLPQTFQWVPQTQTVQFWRFRLHDRPFRSFTLVHETNKIPADITHYAWDGSNAKVPLNSTNRYFWGVFWDAGEVGQGGNLYQAVYFNNP